MLDFPVLLTIAGIAFFMKRSMRIEQRTVAFCTQGSSLVFIAVCIAGAAGLKDLALDSLTPVLIRGLLYAVISYTAFAILLPLGAQVYRHTFGRLLDVFKWFGNLRVERRARRIAAQELKRQEEEWQRTAPERAERERQEQERRLALQQESLRRENARFACEALFRTHRAEIKERFSWKDMERFFQTYMSESQPVAEVERRAEELQAVIEKHRNKVEPIPEEPKSMGTLAEWYEEEKAKINSLTLEQNTKQVQLIRLKERFLELSEAALDAVEP